MMTIDGYGAVFYDGSEGTEYRLADDLVERISPGAFDAVVKERDDVVGLFNHNVDNLLGRTAADTMRLSIDKRGLRYEIDEAETELHNRVKIAQARGDLVGSSMGFFPVSERFERRDGQIVRWIDKASLFDVGPVTNPAYVGTNNRDGYFARCTAIVGAEVRAMQTNNYIESRSIHSRARLRLKLNRWLKTGE